MSIKYGQVKSKKPIRKESKIRLKKSVIKKQQSQMTVHHRRPLSLGGSNKPANISNISEELHKAWTIIAGNMNAEQICNHINTFFKPKNVTLICKFINGSRCEKTGECGSTDPKVISYAWSVLCRNLTHFYQKIELINNVLLDPAYHFYIRD